MQDYAVLEILSNKKVLCLEDEPGILKNITQTLQLFFGEVVGVKDGLEALDEAMTNLYDVLIFDIEVPHIDGLEIIKKIREINHKIPIIILSSHVEQEYLWRAVELKITRYLQKPYDKEKFLKALEDAALELADYHQLINIKGDIKYDFAKKIIYDLDQSTHLSKSESRLFEYFLKHVNQTITYEKLFDYMWEFEQPSKEAIKAIVKEIRRKIGKDVIKNLYGIGYVCQI
ncbi:MAG: response regulator transcription factor [Campylobacter sp.]